LESLFEHGLGARVGGMFVDFALTKLVRLRAYARVREKAAVSRPQNNSHFGSLVAKLLKVRSGLFES